MPSEVELEQSTLPSPYLPGMVKPAGAIVVDVSSGSGTLTVAFYCRFEASTFLSSSLWL